ncbi:MAG: hypothetical protein IJV52_09025 [Prevotella sp.]|nr:hypothetical protein [Prevotella sp.]
MMLNNSLFRRIQLQLLMNLTTRAFGKPAVRTWTMTNDKALQVYAEYTRDHLRDGVSEQLLQRMSEEAYRMGKRLRVLFCLRNPERTMRYITALYWNIGIELTGEVPGRLCFKRCFFSRYYTPAVCLAASALDEGIIRGLAGVGSLTFQQRITEGKDCCKAKFNNGS